MALLFLRSAPTLLTSPQGSLFPDALVQAHPLSPAHADLSSKVTTSTLRPHPLSEHGLFFCICSPPQDVSTENEGNSMLPPPPALHGCYLVRTLSRPKLCRSWTGREGRRCQQVEQAPHTLAWASSLLPLDCARLARPPPLTHSPVWPCLRAARGPAAGLRERPCPPQAPLPPSHTQGALHGHHSRPLLPPRPCLQLRKENPLTQV